MIVVYIHTIIKPNVRMTIDKLCGIYAPSSLKYHIINKTTTIFVQRQFYCVELCGSSVAPLFTSTCIPWWAEVLEDVPPCAHAHHDAPQPREVALLVVVLVVVVVGRGGRRRGPRQRAR